MLGWKEIPEGLLRAHCLLDEKIEFTPPITVAADRLAADIDNLTQPEQQRDILRDRQCVEIAQS
jgi:hypothetical protein